MRVAELALVKVMRESRLFPLVKSSARDGIPAVLPRATYPICEAFLGRDNSVEIPLAVLEFTSAAMIS